MTRRQATPPSPILPEDRRGYYQESPCQDYPVPPQVLRGRVAPLVDVAVAWCDARDTALTTRRKCVMRKVALGAVIGGLPGMLIALVPLLLSDIGSRRRTTI